MLYLLSCINVFEARHLLLVERSKLNMHLTLNPWHLVYSQYQKKKDGSIFTLVNRLIASKQSQPSLEEIIRNLTLYEILFTTS